MDEQRPDTREAPETGAERPAGSAETVESVATPGLGRTATLTGVIVLAVAGGIVFGALTGDEESVAGTAVDSPPAVTRTDHPVPAGHASGAPVDGADLPPDSSIVRVGEAARVGDFVVTLGRSDPDALERLQGVEGAYHDELAPGERAVMATVTVQNTGDHPLDPATDLLAGYLGGNGREYDQLRGPFCMGEDSLYNVGDLPPGQSVTGTLCQGMPAGAVDGGLWLLRPAADYGRATYFAAR